MKRAKGVKETFKEGREKGREGGGGRKDGRKEKERREKGGVTGMGKEGRALFKEESNNLDCMSLLHGCFLILKSSHHQYDLFFLTVDPRCHIDLTLAFGIQTKTSFSEY